MATYSERSNASILDFALDLEGDTLRISRVNGDPALIGVPIPLSIGGAATVFVDGSVTYDDTGLPTLPEGETRFDGLIVSITDGVNEVDAAVSLEIFGHDVGEVATVTFGSGTRAGAGGVPVGGTAIVSGDPHGHFTVAGGYLVPSATGQGALEGSYLLRFDAGDPVLVTIEPGRLDVRTMAELAAACLAAEALNPGTDHAVVLRDGSFGVPGAVTEIAGVQMTGSLSDANAAEDNFSHDETVRATLSGGSVTIRAETPGGAEIAGGLKLTGCDRIRVSGLVFTRAAQAGQPQSYDHGDGDALNGPGALMAQLEIAAGAGPAEAGVVIVEDCRFETPAGTLPGHRARGLVISGMEQAIVQDNRFADLHAGAEVVLTDRTAALRNAFSGMTGAALALSGTDAGHPAMRLEFAANTVFDPLDDASFAGLPASALELSGATAIDLLATLNTVFAPLPGRSAGTGGARRHSRGLVSTVSELAGEITHNLILASGSEGVSLADGQFVQIANNTVLPDTLSSPVRVAIAGILVGADAVGMIAQNNVTARLEAETGAGLTRLGNYTALDPSLATGANSFDSVFVGSFGFATGVGPSYAVDRADASALRASLDALFDTAHDGPAAGLGYRRLSIPVILGLPEVGQVLTVAGTDPGDTDIRWQRDGVVIPGATAPSYTLTPADDGTLITAMRTGSGQFAVSEGVHVGPLFKIVGSQMIGPDGTAFVPRGFNVFAGHYPFSSWRVDGLLDGSGFTAAGRAALEAWGVNALRIDILAESAFTFVLRDDTGKVWASSGQTDLGALIAAATGAGIVCLISFTGWHGSSFLSVNGSTDINPYPQAPSAATQAQVLARLAALARTYKANPYVWFQPYNARGTETDWASFTQPAIDAVRRTGNLNPVICSAPNGGQDLPDADAPATASVIAAQGGTLAGGNIGFGIQLGASFHHRPKEDYETLAETIRSAGLWFTVEQFGGINAGDPATQAQYFAAETFLGADIPGLGGFAWHAGLASYPILTEAGADPTAIDDPLAPTNLSVYGNLLWSGLFGRADRGVHAPRVFVAAVRAIGGGTHEAVISHDTGGGVLRVIGQATDAMPDAGQVAAGRDATGAAAPFAEEIALGTGPGAVTVALPAGVTHVVAYQVRDTSGAADADTSDLVCRAVVAGGVALGARAGAAGELLVDIETFADGLTVDYAVVLPGEYLTAADIRARAATGTDAGRVTIGLAGTATETLPGIAGGRVILAVSTLDDAIAIVQFAGLELPGLAVRFGAETLTGAGAFRFRADSVSIASVGALSGTAELEATVEDGMVSIVPIQDGLTAGSFTLTLPCISDTGAVSEAVIELTVIPGEFTVASASDLEAAYPLANGKKITLREGDYTGFSTESSTPSRYSAQRTTAFRGRAFPAGLTIQSEAVATGSFDPAAQRPRIVIPPESMFDLANIQNVTFDGLEFYMPKIGHGFVRSIVYLRSGARNTVFRRCYIHSDPVDPAAERANWVALGFDRPDLIGTDGTTRPVNLTVEDCVFEDGNNAISAYVDGDVILEGNRAHRVAQDFVKLYPDPDGDGTGLVVVRRNWRTGHGIFEPDINTTTMNIHPDFVQISSPSAQQQTWVEFNRRLIVTDNYVNPGITGINRDVQTVFCSERVIVRSPLVERNIFIVETAHGVALAGRIHDPVVRDNIIINPVQGASKQPQLYMGREPNVRGWLANRDFEAGVRFRVTVPSGLTKKTANGVTLTPGTSVVLTYVANRYPTGAAFDDTEVQLVTTDVPVSEGAVYGTAVYTGNVVFRITEAPGGAAYTLDNNYVYGSASYFTFLAGPIDPLLPTEDVPAAYTGIGPAAGKGYFGRGFSMGTVAPDAGWAPDPLPDYETFRP